MNYHVLSVDERIDFLNDMIRRDMEKHNNSDWMQQEFVNIRFYHRGLYGHDTDEKVHRYMDQKKVPGKIPLGQWIAYKESK